MHGIILFFRRLLMLPYEFISSPTTFITETWNDAGRGRALILGVPAVVIGLIGMGAWAWAVVGNGPLLEKRYDAMAQKTRLESQKLNADITKELRIIASQTQQRTGTTANNLASGLAKDDKRVVRLKELQDQEKIYLDKLIKLNPEDPEYKYRLAKVSLDRGNIPKGLSLMASIAPINKANGYAKAHLWMAAYYVNRQAASTADLKRNRLIALQHADNCLVLDKNNLNAKKIRGQMLVLLGREPEAYTLYTELFDVEPEHYVSLLTLNSILNSTERNENVLAKAVLKFESRINADRNNVEKWVSSWAHYINCLKQQGDFEVAEAALLKELQVSSNDPPRRVFLERELAQVYTHWANDLGVNDQNNENITDEELTASYQRQLETLQKAYNLNPRNEHALRLLTYLGTKPGFEDKAKAIYDAKADPEAPAAVLTELGTDALQKDDYENAIRYFEYAKDKAPKSPKVLNNLAYTYLICENRNPERALLLIDQALLNLPPKVPNREEYLSHFYDTRGLALLQMNRMDEAAASFELALKNRPQNKSILRNLIKCYEGRLDSQAETYRRRLQRVIDNENAKGADAESQTAEN